MSEQPQPVEIEIEDENEAEQEKPAEAVEPEPAKSSAPVPRKKISALTEVERAQLINDAKAGKESEFYHVNFLKRGGVRITERKQTKAQELIQSNNDNPERVELPSSRFLTDNQLLFEHIINLETSFQTLRSKHKKLKKRYNELEGYLYGNDDDDSDDAEGAARYAGDEKPRSQQQPPQEKPPTPQQQQYDRPPPQQSPYVQRRYVRSWRDLRPSNSPP